MATHNATLQDVLLGAGPGQLHLSAVRTRAEELKRSLDQVVQGLQFAADRVQWSDALDRFAVINVQYQHLLDALRPLLRQFAAYPRSVNQTNAPILPIMLATKLLPEMEEQERDLLAQQEGEQQALVPGGARGAAAPSHLSLAEQFAWVQDQEQELNHLIDRLAREEGSPLGEKRRKEVAAAAAKAAAASPAGARPPLLPAVRQVLPGAQQQMRPGPADPLLAAVTFGAGL